jgi:hypothetical protein
VTPTPTAEKRRTSTWIYADWVTGMPFVRQPLVNTHIMSILLQRNSNVHRGILSGVGRRSMLRDLHSRNYPLFSWNEQGADFLMLR